MAGSPQFIASPNNQYTTITNTDGTNVLALFACSNSGGSLVRALNVVNDDDAVAYDVHVYLHDGSAAYPLGTVTIPISAGYVGTQPPVNLLDHLPLVDDQPNRSIVLENSESIRVAITTGTVTVGHKLWFTALGGDF